MKRGLLLVALLGFFFLGGVLVGYWLNPPAEVEDGTVTDRTGEPSPALEPFRPDTPARRPDDRSGPRVAIVIDDVGWSRETTPLFAEVREYVTFALLPGRPYSSDLYERWKNKTNFLVHMPMEPKGYPEDDPGQLALMTSMSSDEVRTRLNEVLDRYPRIAGINNHMGSKFTGNRPLMGTVMDVLNRRNLFYLDSRTSAGSVAVEEARRKGVPVAQNQVFLDNKRSESAVRAQLERLVGIARDEGTGIGIGHFQHEVTARVLRQEIPRYREQGVAFVGVRDVLSGMVGEPGLESSVTRGDSPVKNRL